jgi:hypothetical protein
MGAGAEVVSKEDSWALLLSASWHALAAAEGITSSAGPEATEGVVAGANARAGGGTSAGISLSGLAAAAGCSTGWR